MKSIHKLCLAAFCGANLLIVNFANAAEAKTYQATGPVLEVTPSTITIQGDEKWQMARDKDAKVTGDVKVGDKVTVNYQMTAVAIEVKPSKGKK